MEIRTVKFLRSWAFPAILAAVVPLSISCADGGDAAQEGGGSSGAAQQAPAVNLPPEVMALVDSANALVRADLHEEALELYREAIAQAPDSPIPWFGVSMVARELGNTALADSAQAVLDGAAGREATMSPHTETMPEGHPPTRPPGG